MTRGFVLVSFGIVLMLALCESITLHAHPVARATAIAVVEAPRIDGRLDEPIWRKAVKLAPFVQRTPVQGARPTFPTNVRLLYTPAALYVGIRLWDDQHLRVVLLR